MARAAHLDAGRRLGSVAGGIVFDESGKAVWVSEGDLGTIREIDVNSGNTRKTVNLNGPEWRGSFAGDSAGDSSRRLLYALDPANSRVAVVDLKAGRVVSSVRLGSPPSAIALAPGAATLYVATADSVCRTDVRNVDVQDILKPGPPDCIPADAPRNLNATADRIFVTSEHSDSITVISAANFRVIATIPLQIPSLEQLGGIAPAGMAFDPVTKWLLVAESGINALGIVDTEKNLLIGHIPTGWMPVSVALAGDRVYVANALGRGTGPNLRRPLLEFGRTAHSLPGHSVFTSSCRMRASSPVTQERYSPITDSCRG